MIFIFVGPKTFAQHENNAPIFRGRMGMNMLTFTVGEIYKNEELGAISTFSPTILWSFPTFRSRMGLHYSGDFGSKYGFTPISGVGLSSYFYPYGLSSAYEITPDGTLFQKSKPGPYALATLTPVNFNINTTKDESPTGSQVSFAAYMIEVGLGGGYDYPVGNNMVISAEFQYRFASAQERTTKETVSYSGLGFMLTFSTSYH